MKNDNINNVIKDHIINILIKEKFYDFFKKFRLDYYFVYKYILSNFFIDLNAEND